MSLTTTGRIPADDEGPERIGHMVGPDDGKSGLWPTPGQALRHSDLHWIIVGGESGPGARPMHPDWARSLRDQCNAAGVPFLFKQHGEWLATAFCSDEHASLPYKRLAYIRGDGSLHDGTEGVNFFGGDEEVTLVGKKAAGRQLDGRTWDETPVS